MLLALIGCDRSEHFATEPQPALADWSHVSDYHTCYLRIDREWRPALRVNCFAIEGELFTHSSRLVPIHAQLTAWLGLGGTWLAVVERNPDIQVSIDGAVHNMTMQRITDLKVREEILANRDYDPIPEAIEVYRIVARE